MGGADTRKPDAPLTRAERRRQAQARRNRIILVLGVVASLAVVAAWFPASDLLHQRQQLAAASSQLDRLNAQNRSLKHQAKQLETPAAVGRIAQQQYDLVTPGEQAYQVLPPSSNGGDGTLTQPADGSSSTGGASGGAGTTAGTGTIAGNRTSTKGSGTSSSAAGSSSGFLGRIVQSLEFWH